MNTPNDAYNCKHVLVENRLIYAKAGSNPPACPPKAVVSAYISPIVTAAYFVRPEFID